MIRRMAPAGEMKERLALGARVAVDEHRLRAAPAGLTAIDAALAAATKARIICPRPVDLRRLAVVLLEARAHLALEFFLQAERRRQNGVGIGVLGLEQRADVGRQPARIAQHLAPVVGPHPGVIVDPGQDRARRAMPAGFRRAAGRGRGWRPGPRAALVMALARRAEPPGRPQEPRTAHRTGPPRPPREARRRRHSPTARRW